MHLLLLIHYAMPNLFSLYIYITYPTSSEKQSNIWPTLIQTQPPYQASTSPKQDLNVARLARGPNFYVMPLVGSQVYYIKSWLLFKNLIAGCITRHNVMVGISKNIMHAKVSTSLWALQNAYCCFLFSFPVIF